MREAAILLLLAAGAEAADRTASGEVSFRLVPGFEVTVALTSSRLIGPSLSLSRKGDTWSGTVGRGAANLRLTADGLIGFARGGAVSLHAEKEGPAVVVRGAYGLVHSGETRFAARPRSGRVEIGPSLVRVRDGRCALELTRRGSAGPFRGGGWCDGTYRQAEISLDDTALALLADAPELLGLALLECAVASP